MKKGGSREFIGFVPLTARLELFYSNRESVGRSLAGTDTQTGGSGMQTVLANGSPGLVLLRFRLWRFDFDDGMQGRSRRDNSRVRRS